MRNLILLCLMLVSGFVSAQTFEFNCNFSSELSVTVPNFEGSVDFPNLFGNNQVQLLGIEQDGDLVELWTFSPVNQALAGKVYPYAEASQGGEISLPSGNYNAGTIDATRFDNLSLHDGWKESVIRTYQIDNYVSYHADINNEGSGFSSGEAIDLEGDLVQGLILVSIPNESLYSLSVIARYTDSEGLDKAHVLQKANGYYYGYALPGDYTINTIGTSVETSPVTGLGYIVEDNQSITVSIGDQNVLSPSLFYEAIEVSDFIASMLDESIVSLPAALEWTYAGRNSTQNQYTFNKEGSKYKVIVHVNGGVITSVNAHYSSTSYGNIYISRYNKPTVAEVLEWIGNN